MIERCTQGVDENVDCHVWHPFKAMWRPLRHCVSDWTIFKALCESDKKLVICVVANFVVCLYVFSCFLFANRTRQHIVIWHTQNMTFILIYIYVVLSFTILFCFAKLKPGIHTHRSSTSRSRSSTFQQMKFEVVYDESVTNSSTRDLIMVSDCMAFLRELKRELNSAL